MANPSKRKGDRGERMVVQAAIEAGLNAERARGSDGRSLGHSEKVDVVAAGMRLQVKTRAAWPTYLEAPEGTDGLVLVESRRGSSPKILAVLDFEDLLRLVDAAGGW